ncbi:MAG: glutathione S-transferase family protein [Sphingomonadaceae bacterium]|nr:glutathione S-transferase family protein [Sphingomonadaceae bacterium]
MSTPSVSAFNWVPPFAQGVVRDLRVRWALEEAGIGYEAQLLDFEAAKRPPYLRQQPFGQVPAYSDGQVEMFESGAIVLHIALESPALMPGDDAGRARVMTWIFAALNSIEPAIAQLGDIDLFHAGEAWTAERRPQVEAEVRRHLAVLSGQLEGRDYLEGSFTAGDLMMVTVLRILRHTPLVGEYPVLRAYQARGEARPAFQRALAAQLEPFEQAA